MNKYLTANELSIIGVEIKNDMITARISDGRIISIPLVWFPKLRDGNLKDLNNFEISPSGYGIHWPVFDEDINIRAFLN